jgi:propanol-preferring alcohol dehydrogenase
MWAWSVDRSGPSGSVRLEERPDPHPGPGEVRVRVSACGVCRTDLHLVQGDLAPRRPGAVPGHEIVGRIDERGPSADRFALGERIGIAWLRGVCGVCRYCRGGRENLCPGARFTGWDADGGYARYALIDERFAYRLPAELSDVDAAPLLCAGIVGYRALRRAALPPGGRLGVYGFGASAHLVAQVAIAQGAAVHVLTRAESARRLALSLGAASASNADDDPPEPLDSAILFAPVGDLVPTAARALDRGGTLSIAGIHLSDVPGLNYERELFYERNIVSVTANTRADGEEFLRLAARLGVRAHVQPYPFSAADDALADLAADRITGAAVLTGGPPASAGTPRRAASIRV